MKILVVAYEGDRPPGLSKAADLEKLPSFELDDAYPGCAGWNEGNQAAIGWTGALLVEGLRQTLAARKQSQKGRKG